MLLLMGDPVRTTGLEEIIFIISVSFVLHREGYMIPLS